MSQHNLRKNVAVTEIILANHYEQLRIEYNSECCRVIGMDNYIKAEAFSAKGNSKFRVKIEIESVSDNEQPPKREFVTDFDADCCSCQSNVAHYRHWYMNAIESKLDLRRRL